MYKRTIPIILCLFLLTSLASKSSAAKHPSAAQTAQQQANCGEWQKAIESYDKALTTSPDDAVCLARRGYAQARLGNYKQAFADFTAAIKSDTNCPDAYSRRSRVYFGLGLNQLAKQDARKALGLTGTITRKPAETTFTIVLPTVH
jgi:tetratricopeptide (TPR) repeat protein